jgi:hypothetical protein
MQLPPLLAPWAPWLTLLAPDFAEPVGQLLLRLQPLFGPLSRLASPAPIDPEGIGNIVLRGNFDRLLSSEWVYADAEPDEFIRRAANRELLFIGPEPATSKQPLRSVALFDAGPAQLGQPRLVQLALFILLSRRAQAAGAQFAWGFLHQPGELLVLEGAEAITALLAARTLALPSPGKVAWDAVLGQRPDDCWLIGSAAEQPPQARCRVLIEQPLLGDQLDVTVIQRSLRRKVALARLPAELGLRMLRHPFKNPGKTDAVVWSRSRPSLTRPPRFGTQLQWIAIAQVDGSIAVHQVPSSAGNKAGKVRITAKPPQGTVLSAALFKKGLGMMISHDNTITLTGFPGPHFNGVALPFPRPPVEQFRCPPGTAHWLPMFYVRSFHARRHWERVFAVDNARQLVCWTRSGESASCTRDAGRFEQLRQGIIGAAQRDNLLHYATTDGRQVHIHEWSVLRDKENHVEQIPFSGTEILFGNVTDSKQHAMYALRESEKVWRVIAGGKSEITSIEDGAQVLGCARSERHPDVGLVVLHPARLSIEFRVGIARYNVLTSTERIEQAVYDNGRVAWLGARSRALTVRGLDQTLPYLQIISSGGDDES